MARRNALFEVKQIEQLVRISSTHYLANALFVPACSARSPHIANPQLWSELTGATARLSP